MKKRRILVLMHPDLVPPAPGEDRDERLLYQGKTEIDVVRALGELGHEVRALGVQEELAPIREAVREMRPHVVFNLLEDSTISLTSISTRISWSCRGDGASAAPEALQFPLIVKSLMDEGSFGIAQASVVDGHEKLADRVRFLHGRDADAIVEDYIEGREIAMAIATARVKHDPDYQERRGIRQQRASAISPATEAAIVRTTRRICRILSLDGYARLDYRLREDGTFFFLEGNPNPGLAQSQEFASAAEEAGLAYPALLERAVSLGMRRPVP